MKRKTAQGAQIQDARALFANGSLNVNSMKPFIAEDGKPYKWVYTGRHRPSEYKNPKNYKKQLVTNATLLYDEWRTLDDAVLGVSRNRLVGFDDLRRNGLVYNLGNAMATTVLTWDEMKDAMEAVVSLDPVRRGDNDQVTSETKHLPIPVVHADFTISERILQESRNRGNGLDTMNAEAATRRVREKLEDMLFGSSNVFTYGGGIIYTYLTHPDVNTYTLTKAWNESTKTAEEIKSDIIGMKQLSIDDNHYGPWMVYIPTAYETVLDDDYKSTAAGMSQTIRQRILAIEGIQGIRVVDRLAADTIVMVEMSSDTVQLVDGMPIQTVQWDTEGGFIHNFKVMTIQLPRIRSTYNSAGTKTSGIVIAS